MDYFYENEQRDSCQLLIEINLIHNLKPQKKSQIKIHRNQNFKEIQQLILKSLQMKTYYEIRLFKQNGVEIFEDDFQYIKQQEIFYVSSGEDFNQDYEIAEYETISILGEGGFGSVFLAKHKVTDLLVAIKIVKKDFSQGNINDIDMIFGEANALKNLQHKNIVKMLNCYIFKDMKAVFIMEYLQGGDLNQYLKNNKSLDEKQAQFIFRQIVDAIYYCHQRKIIHRDLKLENIMIDNLDDLNIKVCDFGISGIFCKTNTDQTQAGSTKYISPEVLIDKAPAKPSMDIWAMGVILYQMLHGYCPFEGESRKEIFDKIKKGEYEINQKVKENVTRCCLDLIKSILQLDSQSRISTIEISNHPWINQSIDEIKQQELLEQEKDLQQVRNNKTTQIDKKKNILFDFVKENFLNKKKKGQSQNQNRKIQQMISSQPFFKK